MGMLADQAFRLIRTKWKGDADLLAEELFAIFRSKDPVQFDSPIQITNPTDGPPIEVSNTSPSNDANTITATGSDGSASPVNFDLGSTTTGGGSTSSTTTGGGGIPAKILSGTGATYSVALYENGVSAGTTGTATVTQLQIDAGETIPANTWTIVTKIGTSYFMQVPVWL